MNPANPEDKGSASGEEHKLQNAYSFWYMKRGNNKNDRKISIPDDYEKAIKSIGTFSTVEEFWRLFSHMVQINDVTPSIDFHLFKNGIKPVWEDIANKRGGKTVIRLRKGLGSHFWETVVLAIIGEQFDVGNEICGAVISCRYNEDILSIWNRNTDNSEAIARIKENLRHILQLPGFVKVEYKKHDSSAGQDKGSHRNSHHHGGWRSRGHRDGPFGGHDGGNGGNHHSPYRNSGSGMRSGVGERGSSRGQPWSESGQQGGSGKNRNNASNTMQLPSAFGKQAPTSPRGGGFGGSSRNNRGGFSGHGSGSNRRTSGQQADRGGQWR